MILNKVQIEELNKAAQPLVAFLNANCHPHCTVIVTSAHVELVEGIAGVPQKIVE